MLSELAKSVAGASKPKGAAVEIEVEPLDSLDAAARLLKAIESKDVHGIDDALRLHYEACESEHGEPDGDEG